MGTISETGHDVNIANFKLIIMACGSFGVKYNPSNALISVAAMETQYAAAVVLQSEYVKSTAVLKLPVNEREDLLVALRGIVVRVVALLGSTEAGKSIVKDVKGLARKMTGSNVKRKRLANGDIDPKSVSNSHLGIDSRLENFNKFVELLALEPLYVPNETDLQVVSLRALLADLQAAVGVVDTLEVDVNMKRLARDRALYKADVGILDVALACKNYVKAVFGSRGLETHGVTGIYMKRIIKRF